MAASARVTDEATVKAFLATPSFRRAAAALGITQTAVRKRLLKLDPALQGMDGEARLTSLRGWAAERGLLGLEPVLPGYAVKRTTVRYDAEGDVSATYVTQGKAKERSTAMDLTSRLQRKLAKRTLGTATRTTMRLAA